MSDFRLFKISSFNFLSNLFEVKKSKSIDCLCPNCKAIAVPPNKINPLFFKKDRFLYIFFVLVEKFHNASFYIPCRKWLNI